MNYLETVDFLYGRLPMFQNQGSKAYQRGLDRTLALLDKLGNPHLGMKFIHVGGTNGKGSTTCLIASVLQEAGYKVGLYTSPHLKSFTERIKINGIQVQQDFVVDFVAKTKEFIEEIKPSFFELTVAMALYYFKKCKVDVAVVEVGLGGRIDSTNVITPILSVITNIGLDHMDLLGDNVLDIAKEKAGIIKENIPLVLGRMQDKEVLELFDKEAAVKKSKLFITEGITEGMDYGAENILVAKMALSVIQKQGVLIISEDNIAIGIDKMQLNVGLRGRMEKVFAHPDIWCDIAHNTDGIRKTLTTFRKNIGEPKTILIGMVKDKDHQQYLKELPKSACYFFYKPSVVRGLDAFILKDLAEKCGLKGSVVTDLEDFKNNLTKIAGPMLVTGSAFTVSDYIMD